jgi:hypothetical protein
MIKGYFKLNQGHPRNHGNHDQTRRRADKFLYAGLIYAKSVDKSATVTNPGTLTKKERAHDFVHGPFTLL